MKDTTKITINGFRVEVILPDQREQSLYFIILSIVFII